MSLAVTIEHVTRTRAGRWPATAACPCHADGRPCSRYLSDDGRTCATYVCAGCKRRLPACFGAADESPDLCDDCVAASDVCRELRALAAQYRRDALTLERRGPALADIVQIGRDRAARCEQAAEALGLASWHPMVRVLVHFVLQHRGALPHEGRS